MKRLRPAGRERRCTLADALRRELSELYSKLPATILWDTAAVQLLRRPTNNVEHASSKYYNYVGREQAEVLYEKINVLEAGNHLQVLGAKGSGKSIVVAAIAGYLIGNAKQVVYLSVKRLLENPFLVLLDSLLVACGRDAELLNAGDFDDLLACCMEREGPLVFVVDDWDQLEHKPELEEKLLCALNDHILVKVSSVNSRERQIWTQSDKADYDIFTVFFDGPYSSSELDTWIGQSDLNREQLQDLHRLTGAMPRLLQFYQDVGASEARFLQKIQTVYTDKLFTKFIGKLNSRVEVRAALDLVISGVLSAQLSGKVDFTCFYRDVEGKYCCISPFLKSKAEQYIMERHGFLESSLVLNDIWTWALVVEQECLRDGANNPARVGWNVEGLVIGVMKFRQQIFGFGFKHVKTYARGGELQALARVTPQELAEGVLLVPEAFNEKAVDVIYIILDVEKQLVKIKALQITVATWKAKAKMESHKVWEDDVLPNWTRGLNEYEVRSEYYYVMPHSVKLEDMPRGVAAFKSFADVHECLRRFDELLKLPEPAAREKPALRQCTHIKKNQERCKNQARSEDDPYFCSRHVAFHRVTGPN